MSFSAILAEPASKTILTSDMSLNEAASNVRHRQGDRVLGARTKNIDGKKMHVIKTLSADGRVKYIQVDPRSRGKRKKNRR